MAQDETPHGSAVAVREPVDRVVEELLLLSIRDSENHADSRMAAYSSSRSRPPSLMSIIVVLPPGDATTVQEPRPTLRMCTSV